MSVTYAGTTEPVRQILHHHAVLRRGLEQSVAALCAAVESGVGHERELSALRDFLAGEILPHAAAEESTLYPAAVTTARGSELVTGLTAEHRDLAGLVGRLASDTVGRERAMVAEWIATLFAGHVAKENDLLLPALTEAGADLAELLARMHDAHKVVRDGPPSRSGSPATE